jgi:hypothetical protein
MLDEIQQGLKLSSKFTLDYTLVHRGQTHWHPYSINTPQADLHKEESPALLPWRWSHYVPPKRWSLPTSSRGLQPRRPTSTCFNASLLWVRPRHSTTLECTNLKLSTRSTSKMSTAAVFLDVEKAFDIIWHPIKIKVFYKFNEANLLFSCWQIILSPAEDCLCPEM